MCALKDTHPRQFPTGLAVTILKDAFISVCFQHDCHHLKSTTALADQSRDGHKQTSEVQSTTEAQAFFRKENMQKAGKAENVKKKFKLWVV